MSMFSKLFGRVSTETATPQAQLSSDDENEDDNNEMDRQKHHRESTITEIDVSIEVGGGKGWPQDVTSMMYHSEQGLICVGTEGGAIYTFGDGFQYMRPWLTEEANECISIVPLFPDKILVAFANNSVVILELPSLNVIDLLDPNWLHKKCGDISCVRNDAPGEKNFVYVGTTEGFMFVLDANDDAELTVVDYLISCKSLGLRKNMTLSDIQVYPKDEKYVALGYDGDGCGAVVIYDHQKQKAHRVFETKAITSMTWQHRGDTLYAGTREGEILAISMEKQHFNCIWNAVVHKEDDVTLNAGGDDLDGDFDEFGGSGVGIRRVYWLAPQPPSEQGCLFILLAARGVDTENLRNVVIGLSASGKTGDMEEVYALPPISGEKIIGMKIVPTYDRNDERVDSLLNGTSMELDDPIITPGLILLTQKQVKDTSTLLASKFTRSLKIARCPVGDVKLWSLEIGALPDPRIANEVQAAASEITCITGFSQQRSALSLAAMLIRKSSSNEGVIGIVPAPTTTGVRNSFAAMQNEEKGNTSAAGKSKGRRLSAREFNTLNQLNIMEMEAQLNETDNWEMVLAHGEHEGMCSKLRTERAQDIIMKGHADGSIIAWGVSLPKEGKECGNGNIWLPLIALRCGAVPISCINYDESAGLLFAADVSGAVVIWEIYDEEDNLGSIDALKKVYSSATKFAGSKLAQKVSGEGHDSDEDGDDDERSNSGATAYITYSSYRFNGIREVLRAGLPVMVTASLIVAPLLLVIVGGEDGSVYACSDWAERLFYNIDCLPLAADKRRGTAAAGHVLGFRYSSYYDGERVMPAIYVMYSSGGIAIIDIGQMKMVAGSAARDNRRDSSASEVSDRRVSGMSQGSAVAADGLLEEETDADPFVTDFCVMNSNFLEVKPPSLHSVCRMLAENAAAAARQPSGSMDSTMSSISSNEGSEDAPKSRMRFFSNLSGNTTKTPPSGHDSAIIAEDDIGRSTNSVLKSTIGLVRNIAENKIPRYIMYAKGSRLYYFDVSKLTRANCRHSNSAAVAVGGFYSKSIAHHPIVASRFVSFRTRDAIDRNGGYASEDEDNALLCVACVDNEGGLLNVSVESKLVLSKQSLVYGVVDETVVNELVDFGTVLPNGNFYLFKRESMLYTATMRPVDNSANLILPFPLPDRCSPDSSPPNYALQLRHGREEINDNMKKAIQKRRSSVIKLSSAPTDLYKIFSKSRATIATEGMINDHFHAALVGGKAGGGDQDESSSVAQAHDSTSRAKAAMNETAEALAERGRRINELANKMEDFKHNATVYKEQAHEQRKAMQRRTTRWGLF